MDEHSENEPGLQDSLREISQKAIKTAYGIGQLFEILSHSRIQSEPTGFEEAKTSLRSWSVEYGDCFGICINVPFSVLWGLNFDVRQLLETANSQFLSVEHGDITAHGRMARISSNLHRELVILLITYRSSPTDFTEAIQESTPEDWKRVISGIDRPYVSSLIPEMKIENRRATDYLIQLLNRNVGPSISDSEKSSLASFESIAFPRRDKTRRPVKARNEKRDKGFLELDSQGMTAPEIATYWNRINRADQVSDQVVRKAIERARKKQEKE
jgi:hypothetical protein